MRFDFDGKPLGELKNELISFPSLMRELNGKLLLINGIIPVLRKENKGGYTGLYLFDPNANKIIHWLPNYYHFTEDKRMDTFYLRRQEQLDITEDNAAYYNVMFSDTLYRVKDEKDRTIYVVGFRYLGKGRFSHTDTQQPKAAIGARSKEAMNRKIMMYDIFVTGKHMMLSFAYFESDEKTSELWLSIIWKQKNISTMFQY